jgi:hypothetical protein
MKLNPTFFEIVLALLISLTIYVWVKHGKLSWTEMYIRSIKVLGIKG